MKQISFLSIIFALLFVSTLAQIKQKLTELEVAQRFETFVIENGYTDLPSSQDKSKLVPESVHGGTDEDTIKLFRYNTLERKPLKVTKGNRLFKDGWTAIFPYRQSCEECDKNAARIIYMDAYGENIKVEHQDIILNKKERNKRLKNAPFQDD